MRSPVPLLVLMTSLIALSGCGSPQSADDSTSTPSASEHSEEADSATEAADDQPSPTEEDSASDESERGNQMGEIGDTATMTLDSDPENPIVTFAVNSIEVDPACTGSFPQEPENGHFIAVDIEAQTGTSAQFEEAFYGQDFQFNPNFWKLVDADGKTANSVTSGPSYSCIPENERIPDMIGPSEDVSGTLILDVPSTDGVLIFEEPMSGLGWEWKIPA